MEGGDVTDLVWEEGCFADVLTIEEVVCEAGGCWVEVEGPEVGDCAMAKRAPGEGVEGKREEE